MHDDGGCEEYKRMAGFAIKEQGGRVLVTNSDLDHREGSLPGSVVVVELANLAAARRFEILARQVFIRFKARLMEPSAWEYPERNDTPKRSRPHDRGVS